ncbi:MAG: hypothetical protein AAF597_00240 [Bacteroidota bacterium]
MFLRTLLLLLFMAPAAPLKILAQERVEATPELDSLQEVLSARLREVNDLFDRARENPQLLEEIGSYLSDDRPYVFQKFGDNSLTKPFGHRVNQLLHRSVDFQYLFVTDSLSQEKYEAFWTEYGDQVTFSPLLMRFTDAPLINRELEYRLKEAGGKPSPIGDLNYLKAQIAADLKSKQYGRVSGSVKKIGELGTAEAYQHLQQLANGELWLNGAFSKTELMYISIGEALGNFSTREAAELILDIAETHKLEDKLFVLEALARITNHHPDDTGTRPTDILLWYREKMAAHPRLSDLVQRGYDRVAPFTLADCENPGEYYARLVLGGRNYPHLHHNAIRDALALKDSFSLAIVGAQILVQPAGVDHFNWSPDLTIPQLMEQWTGVVVEVQNAEGEWTDRYADRVSRSNYASYWLQHAMNYSWDEFSGRYLNAVDPVTPIDSIDYLIGQLYQPMKQPAIEAFFRLTEQDSNLMNIRLGSDDLRWDDNRLNRYLSGSIANTLPELIHLSAWYRNEGINYHTTARHRNLIARLEQRMAVNERLWLEDSIVDVLAPEDIVPLEYRFIVRSGNYGALKNSHARILERWYGKHFMEMVASRKALRCYLKRSYHYGRNPYGTLDAYALRFRNAAPEVVAMLEQSRADDPDIAIRAEAAKALRIITREQSDSLPEVDSAATHQLVEAFLDRAAPTKEDFEKVMKLEGLSISQVQRIVERLPELGPCEYIFFICSQFKGRALSETELDFFSNCEINQSEVTTILNTFSHLEPEVLFRFIDAQAGTLSREEIGELYFILVNYTPFGSKLLRGEFSETVMPKVIGELRKYDAIMVDNQGFNDVATLLKKVEDHDLPVRERLAAHFANDSIISTELLVHLLRLASYEDLADIVDVTKNAGLLVGDNPRDETGNVGYYLTNFFVRERGIPLLYTDSIELLQPLAADLRSLSEKELYTKYLEPYRLGYKLDGHWDFDRVYDILEYDVAVDFAGSGQMLYDKTYTHALIRVLELEFETRLDEPRAFKAMTAWRSLPRAKRARKWQQYLIDQGLVKLADDYVGSVSFGRN